MERKMIGLYNKYKLGKVKVLELGCGKGEALKLFGPSSTGIELDKVRYDELKKKKLNVIKMDLEEKWTLKKESYNAVWASHILEHMINPLLVLNNIRNILKKEGVLLATIPIVTKNPIHKYLLYHGNPAWSLDIHPYAYTDTTFKFLLKNAGFKVVESGLFVTKYKLINRILSPPLRFLFGQKTYVCKKDPLFKGPRISVPKKLELLIKHRKDYVRK